MSHWNHKIRNSFHRQHDQSDCGVACLQSIISYYRGSKSLEQLREFSGTSRQGTTLLGLYQAAQKCGFQAQGLESNTEWLKTIDQPVILHVIIDKHLQHYLVCYGYQKGLFVIGDPAKGMVEYTEKELSEIWQSKALLKLTLNESFVKLEKVKKDKLTWFKQLIKEDFSLLSIVFVLSLVVSVLGVTMAIYSQRLIDDILPSKDIEKLIVGTVLLLILLSARGAVNYLSGFFGITQSKLFNNRLINHFFSGLLYLPKSFFDNRRIGELVARMNDTNQIQATITRVIGQLLKDFLMVLVGCVVLFTYSPAIGFVVLGSIPIFAFISYRYHKQVVKSQQEAMAANANKSSNYINTMQGIDSVKAYKKENEFNKLNKLIYGNFQDKVFSLGKVGISLQLSAEIVGVLITIAVLATGSCFVIADKLTIGSLIAILGISGSIFPAITSLAFANVTLQGAKVAFDRMYEFTSIKPEYDKEKISTDKIMLFDKLQIKNLCFRFPGRKQILNDINLNLTKGEVVAILGESGGGKSTLLNILQGFYKAESGSVLLNNQSLGDIYLPNLRDALGVVPQDIAVFNGTLLDNLTLGGTEAELKACIEFCQQTGFEKYFSLFPQSYATLLGEQGINISGGQKQLIGLCRALFKKPSLLLLDEPTSAMDIDMENFALKILNNYKNQCGILIVTHQLKIANVANRIYILKDSTIQAEGTKEDLLNTKNLYSQMMAEIVQTTSFIN